MLACSAYVHRVSHFGGANNFATSAWNSNEWLDYDMYNPFYIDEGINIVYRFPSLDAGTCACDYPNSTASTPPIVSAL